MVWVWVHLWVLLTIELNINVSMELGIPFIKEYGVEDEIRTRDLLLGKEMLYH